MEVSLSPASSTSGSSSFTSLEQNLMNSYFKNMPQFDVNYYTDVDDEMASKEKRLETFKNWPSSSPINPIDLVNAGFYYTGINDLVRCFSCDVKLKQWLRGDDPFIEHKRAKPECNFVVESERERNGVTCVGETASSPVETSAYTRREHTFPYQNKQYQHQPTFSNYPLPSDPGYLSGYTGIKSSTESEIQQPYYEQQQIQSPVSEESLTYRIGNPSSTHYSSPAGTFVTSQYPSLNQPVLQRPSHFTSSMRPYLGRPGDFQQSGIRPQFGNRPQFGIRPQSGIRPPQVRAPQSNYMGMHREFPRYQESIPSQPNHPQMRRVDIPVQSPVLQHLPNVHVRTEDIHHTASQTDLQNIHKRLSTFIDWPEDCSVRPWELASAGFYYLGTGDNVRCYKCSVALRNWEPDDTPWAEHKRWSATCPLVIEYDEGRQTNVPVEDIEQSTETTYQRISAAQPRTKATEKPVPSEDMEPTEQWEPVEKNIFGFPENNQKAFDQYYEHSANNRDPTGHSNEFTGMHYYETQGWEPITSQSVNENQIACVSSTSTEVNPVLGSPQNIQHIRNPDLGPVNPDPIQAITQVPGPTQEVRTSDLTPESTVPISAMNQGYNDSLNDRDFMRAMEMGFSRDDIDKVIAKQAQRTGRGFAKLDDLMQALLDDSDGESEQTSSLSQQSSSFNSDLSDPQLSESQPNQMRCNQNWLPSAQSFSFEQNEPGCSKRALKRSNSAPPTPSSVYSNPSELAKRELEQMREERLICKICMDAEVGVVFLPCGHISCCPNCASGLELCPMCRKQIRQVVRTFLS